MITFGPVSSRRLGKSLGINNIFRPKSCTYNCVYCQVGKTRKCDIMRREYFLPGVIENQICDHLRKLNQQEYPDYLTFVANGEPTLDINLGESINLLKRFKIPIAVITNASLLGIREVRENLHLADWVSLKVDVPDEPIWQAVNRPHLELDFDNHMVNIQLFAKDFKGTLCTETMLVRGINDHLTGLKRLAKIVAALSPHKAYLSVPIRPPAESNIKIPKEETLNTAWQIYSEQQIETELLTGWEGARTGYTGNAYEDILSITAVHPLREEAMDELLQHDKADKVVLKELLSKQLISVTEYNGKKYYLRKFIV